MLGIMGRFVAVATTADWHHGQVSCAKCAKSYLVEWSSRFVDPICLASQVNTCACLRSFSFCCIFFFFSVLPYGRSLAAKFSILAGPRPFSSSLHTIPSQANRQSYLYAFCPVPSISFHNFFHQPVPSHYDDIFFIHYQLLIIAVSL